jgi:hypothetical protein
MYPSMEAIVGLGLAYLLLVPLGATALAYGAARLWLPFRPIPWLRAFGWALLIWIAGMLIFNYSSLGQYLSDPVAMAVGSVLTLGAAVGAIFFQPGAKPPAGP